MYAIILLAFFLFHPRAFKLTVTQPETASIAHSAKHVLVLSYFPVSCLTVILVALKDVAILIGAIWSKKSSGGLQRAGRDNCLVTVLKLQL